MKNLRNILMAGTAALMLSTSAQAADYPCLNEHVPESTVLKWQTIFQGIESLKGHDLHSSFEAGCKMKYDEPEWSEETITHRAILAKIGISREEIASKTIPELLIFIIRSIKGE